MGLDPAPFSLRQLLKMVEGKRKQNWHHTAVLACAISNPWRGQNHALKMEDFPYCQELKPKLRNASKAEFEAFANAWNQ